MTEQRALRFKIWFGVSVKYFRVEDKTASAILKTRGTDYFEVLTSST